MNVLVTLAMAFGIDLSPVDGESDSKNTSMGTFTMAIILGTAWAFLWVLLFFQVRSIQYLLCVLLYSRLAVDTVNDKLTWIDYQNTMCGIFVLQ